MPDYLKNSVGLVKPQKIKLAEPVPLACGVDLPDVQLVYETYGTLNANQSNAILICHALSSDHHVAGYYQGDKRAGWWENYVGPGKEIDTKKFFVVCCNNIGGCSGSTGPTSTNPANGDLWGGDFPSLRVRDWVYCQRQLMRHLNISQWAAIIGSSLGGMQVMRWAVEYPETVRHCLVIASAMKLTAQNIAFNKISREAITSDLNFHKGHYLKHNVRPTHGLKIARMLGHLTYMSDAMMASKFGRELREGTFKRGTDAGVSFQIESYLEYKGNTFAERFDANSYLLMTKALDYFDLAREYDDDAVRAFSRARADFFIMSFTSDWRFVPERSREIVNNLIQAQKRVSYVEIESEHGHDAFLLPNERVQSSLRAYMKRVA